jgi:hypothetical protein
MKKQEAMKVFDQMFGSATEVLENIAAVQGDKTALCTKEFLRLARTSHALLMLLTALGFPKAVTLWQTIVIFWRVK